MEPITHFSHEHPLNLLKQLPKNENNFTCSACQQPLLQEEKHIDVYGCELCESFFLHKSCAQLPMEIVHKSHEHSLFLHSKHPPAAVYSNLCRICYKFKACSFFYYCYLCNFFLDTECAFREKDSVVSRNQDLIFHHPCHKHHPLTVHPRPALFLCDACHDEDKDLFYHCSPCHYYIHKRCAMLPSTTTLGIHSHPLTLAFRLPSQYHNFVYFCDICYNMMERTREFWFYYCDLCRYFVHIKCMAKKKLEFEVDCNGLVIDDLPRLPMSDKSLELIQPFLQKRNNLINIHQKVSIFSHEHPLIYSNDEFIDEDDDEEILCDACIEPIYSPPYYHCTECKYFLHLSCANLPQQLQHSSHPHPLILNCKTRFDEAFRCNNCGRHSNGFFFYCTMESCEFFLDLKCAALPNLLQHEYHNHPLVQKKYAYMTCRGCGKYFGTSADFFNCMYSCPFALHLNCVLLPKKIKHRFDHNHPLILRFPPHSYHPKPFDCAECETEINPLYWLYHCEECDLSFHVYCVNPAWIDNNKKFGQKVKIDSHPHPLKYVYQASVSHPNCHQCKKHMDNPHYVLECETCNFRLCKECVKKIEPLCQMPNKIEESLKLGTWKEADQIVCLKSYAHV